MPTPYEVRQISEIVAWMGRSLGAISQLADGFLSPVTRLAGKHIPEKAMLKAFNLGSAVGKACSHLRTIRRFAGILRTINALYLSDVRTAARRTFQERWLREKGLLHRPLGRLPATNEEILEAEIIYPS